MIFFFSIVQNFLRNHCHYKHSYLSINMKPEYLNRSPLLFILADFMVLGGDWKLGIDSVLHEQSPGLVGGKVSTKKCVLTVKVLDDLLESCVLGLDVEEVDDEKFECKPDVVDDVVFPSECLESHGIDVGVEEQREIDSEEHKSQSLH